MQTIDTTSNIIKIRTQTGFPVSRAGVAWPYRLLKVFLWSCVSLLITVVVLEAILTVTWAGETEMARIDPVLGLVHLKNKVFTFRTEGYSRERLNSNGDCDYERPLVKAPGIVRIAVLGDSETEAMQVPMKDRFTSLLENSLNKSRKSKVEVLNFGMSSFCTGQEYLQFVYKVAAFKPDITILCYHDGDDIESAELSSLRPTFGFHPPGPVSVRWVEFDRFCKDDASLSLRFFNWGRTNSRVLAVLLQLRASLRADPIYQRICQHLTCWTNAFQRVGRYLPFAFGNRAAEKSDSEAAHETKISLERLKICQDAGLFMDTSQRQYPNVPIDYWKDFTLNSHVPGGPSECR